MATPDVLRGLTIAAHGANLGPAASTLTDAGAIVSMTASASGSVHLVPEGKGIAVMTDLDKAPSSWIASPPNPSWLLTAIRTAVELQRAQHAARESQALLEICRAMGSEHESDALHRLIVRKARELTNADAGSLYLFDEFDGQRMMRFAVAQTGPHDEEKHTGSFLALTEGSIAGCVAISGEIVRVADAYQDLPAEKVKHDATFDEATGYHTKSVLCVPIRNFEDNIVGVLQLINKKPSFDIVLTLALLTEQLVLPFDEHDEEILTALAAQAGVVLENTRALKQQ
ncbi:MAG: GAF domain-containing protein [Candidatus Eremiobacteraeota bacterium]|nr:GAF domain-containing protein [Candidatus Eremiobacteraeota bacterium]